MLISVIGPALSAYDNELNCIVCHALIFEAEKAINKVDPKKILDIGGRVQIDGSMDTNKKPYRRSSIHLDELVETVCDIFDDYVHGVWKDSGKRAVIPIMIDGGMNPDFSKFEVKQDGDLNKGIKSYCSMIVNEEEETLQHVLSEERDDPARMFCEQETNICGEQREEL